MNSRTSGVAGLALAIALATGVRLAGAPASQTFTGTITDDMCPAANHAAMRMGPTDRECAIACADAHGAMFVLYDGQHAYGLSDQAAALRFAGQRARVTGALDGAGKTIKVESMTAAN